MLCSEDDDWNVVVLKCDSLAARWEKLSAFLGLPKSLIDEIRGNHPGDLSCCWNEALSQWIKQNYNTEKFGKPSWRTLLVAISYVDKRLFEKLAGEHKLHHDHIGVLPLPVPSEHPSQVQVNEGKHTKFPGYSPDLVLGATRGRGRSSTMLA